MPVGTKFLGDVAECREITCGDPCQYESGWGDARQGFGHGGGEMSFGGLTCGVSDGRVVDSASSFSVGLPLPCHW